MLWRQAKLSLGKNGNTNTLCEQFKKGAEAKGHHVDLVRIMEKKIGFCLACKGYFFV